MPAGLLALPYAAGLLLPAAAVGPAATLAGAGVATAAAGGLRTVTRSPALARTLGGSDRQLRLAHLVVPAVVVTGWVALAVPAIGPRHPLVALLALVAAVGYARVQAPLARPDFTAPLTDFGFGVFQPQVVGPLAKGLFLLVLACALQVLAVGAGW